MNQNNRHVGFLNMEPDPMNLVNDDHVQKKFNVSVASLSDLYKLNREPEVENQQENSFQDRRHQHKGIAMKNVSKSPKDRKLNGSTMLEKNGKINHIFIGEIPGKQDALQRSPSKILEVNYLKPATIPPSSKYSHVISGKINPPKSHFSLKPETEKNIKDHEEQIKPTVLYANRIKIHHNPPEKRISSPPQKMEHESYQHNNTTDMTNLYVIGEGISNKFPQVKPKKRSLTCKRSLSQSPKDHSTKESRRVLKTAETLFSGVTDFFTSNNNKIPSKMGINEIAHYAEEVEASLEKFRNEATKASTKISTQKSKGKNFIPVKDSLMKYRKRSPKEYPQISQENRKKIEEKLSRLHTELRYIMDNLENSDEREKDEKLQKMIQKAKKLSQMIRNFSQEYTNSVSLLASQKYRKEREYSPAKRGSSLSKGNLKISNDNQIKEEVEDVIDVLKEGMENVKVVEENQMIMENLPDTDKNWTKDQKYFIHKNGIFQNDNEQKYKIASHEQPETVFYSSHLKNNRNANIGNSINHNESIPLQSFNQSIQIPNANISQSFQVQPVTSEIGANVTRYGYSPRSNLGQSQYSNPGQLNNLSFQNNNYLHDNRSIVNYATNTGENFNSAQKFTSPTAYHLSDQNFSNSKPEMNKEATMKDTSDSRNQVKINTHNPIRDNRFTSFNVEFPVDYYYKITKNYEPSPEKDWYIRPHHTETFAKGGNAIPDDILNTKYISYYAPGPRTTTDKTREECLNELISEVEGNINNFKCQMLQDSTKNKELEKLYKRLEDLKEEVKKEYVPGKYLNNNSKFSVKDMLSDKTPSDRNFSDMFEGNADIHQSNLAISSYQKILEELREKERKIILQKRKEEYERIRPPKEKWYEMKSHQFQDEMKRNKMVINASPDYFKKLSDLKNDNLY